MRSVSNRGMFRPPLSRPNHVRIKGLNASQPGHKFGIGGQLVAIVVFKLLILYRMKSVCRDVQKLKLFLLHSCQMCIEENNHEDDRSPKRVVGDLSF